MIAYLQRWLVALWAGLALLWLAGTYAAGKPGWAVVGALALTTGHALILAMEFTWMHWANRHDPTPRAHVTDLGRAWLAECLHAPRVFCWRQPFREWAFTSEPPRPQRRRGVLLLHGFVCNRGIWNPWRARLAETDTPAIAISLEPPFGSIENHAQQIEEAIAALERSTGLPPIVVAHSMGGLALRHWWRLPGNAPRVHHALTLGTPHHGTQLAAGALTPNGRQMRQGSDWLKSLQASEPPERAMRLTCFYSHCDNIVFPASTATQPGADNRHLPATAHVAMVDHPEPWAELQRRLKT
jgi:triacylglycerol lipase